MTKANPPTTPIATSKTAALARVLDVVPKGYVYYIAGTCPARKLEQLLQKFHERYGIGCSPAQRLIRKKKGQANALMVVHAPWPASTQTPTQVAEQSPEEDAKKEAGSDAAKYPGRHLVDLQSILQTDTLVSWLLLATPGTGLVWEEERLKPLTESPRLVWLGYELARRSERGRTAWTWRRPKHEMEALYALLDDQLKRHHHAAVTDTLVRIARQPGFHGVREQSWQLCLFAKRLGFQGELPFLAYVQKLAHGTPLPIGQA